MKMNTDSYNCDKLISLLVAGKTYEAITELEEAYPEPCDDILRVKSNYRYLIEYFAKGMEDPERVKVLMQIRKEVAILIFKRKAISLREPGVGHPLFITTLEQSKYSVAEEVSRLGDLVRDEDTKRSPLFFEGLERLFDLIWCTYPLSGEDTASLRYLLTDCGDDLVLRTVVNALYLGTSLLFDPAKCTLLIDACRHEDMPIRTTAAPALLMIGRQYEDLIATIYPDLVAEGSAVLGMLDEEELYASLNAIFSSYKTEDDNRIFRERIEPQLEDLAKRMQGADHGNILEHLKGFDTSQDADGIERTMLEIHEELPKDRDLGYHTIVKLKGGPFFRSVVRFFLPFDSRHSALKPENAKAFEKILPLTFREGMLCSSDRYSFASIEYWERVLETMGSFLPDTTSMLEEGTPDFYAKDFVFGLYRFVYLSPWQGGFHNPFEGQPNVCAGAFTTSPSVLSDSVVKRSVNRLVSMRLYELVRVIVEMRYEHSCQLNDPMLRRMLAVVYYHRKEYDKTLSHLQKVVELEGATAEVTQRLGMLYRMKREYEEAEVWYRKASELAPDNIDILKQYGILLGEELNSYDEAIRVFYKAFFLTDGKDSEVVYDFARLLIRSGKAQDAYERLQEFVTKDREALMLQGISLLALGRRDEGLEKIVASQREMDRAEHIESALKLLYRYGWSASDISLMVDAIRMKKDMLW